MILHYREISLKIPIYVGKTCTISRIPALPLKLVWRCWANQTLNSILRKVFLGNTLVKISAVWWQDWMCRKIMLLTLSSLIKCLPISTCFVQSWWIGLFAIFIMNCLLHNTFIGSGERFLIHPIPFISTFFYTSWVKVLNSTSDYSLISLTIFLLLQVIKFPHIYVQYLEVNFLLVIKLNQSASVYIWISWLMFFLKNSPPYVIFRYLKIRTLPP